MQKNIITNKISACCTLPFSVIYWWVSNMTLNSTADRNFILSQISQNGTISIDGWKVLINSATLEADASLTKAELLAWFECKRQPSCEQLKILIESFKMSSWTPETALPPNIALIDMMFNGVELEGNVFTKEQTLQLLSTAFGGDLAISEIADTNSPKWWFLSDEGTYTNAGGIVAEEGQINIGIWDGSAWSNISVGLNLNESLLLYKPNSEIIFPETNKDKYVTQSAGFLAVSGGFYASEFIPLPKHFNHLELREKVYHQFALYDKHKVFIPTTFSENSVYSFDIPNDAYYLRITSRTEERQLHKVFLTNRKQDLYLANYLNGIVLQKIKKEDVLTFTDKYIGGGYIGDASGYFATEMIRIPENSDFLFASDNYQQFCFYDNNKNYINTGDNLVGNWFYKIPSNARFIACTIRATEASSWFVKFLRSSDFDALDNLQEKEYFGNDMKLIDGYYITGTNGGTVAVAGYSITDEIPLPINVNFVKFTEGLYSQFAFYDNNYNYVTGADGVSEFNIPKNARYIRVTVRNTEKASFSMKFSKKGNDGIVKTTKVKVSTANGANAVQTALNNISDNTAQNRYKIEVGKGLYKVTNSSQYIGNVPSYPAMICPKDHVDIVGESKEDTVLWAELPYNDGDVDTATDRGMHQTVWGWADDSTIENITFVAKNIRYTVHQDNPTESYKSRKYKNCDFIFIGNKGSQKCFGIGTWSGSKTYVEGGRSVCHNTSPVAIHNQAILEERSLWSFKNHEFISYNDFVFLTMQNSGSMIGDDLILEGCSFGGAYLLDYKDWWIYYPNGNDHFNHAEWRITGSGNERFLFSNNVNGKSLKITANTVGEKVRFDKNSTAFSKLIKNNKGFFGHLGHPERKIIDDYVVFDASSGLNSYAFGCLSIREDGYLFGTTTSQDSMGKRLGDCTANNVTLTVIIGSTTKNIVFNQNYTTKTNAEIITFINSVLGSSAVASEFNVGLDYYPELSDVNFIVSNGSNAVIEKGSFVKIQAGTVVKAQDGDEVFGIAIDDFQPRSIVQGEVFGIGRVVKNCLIEIQKVRTEVGISTAKNSRYKVVNGVLTNDVNGKIVAFENNVIEIK